MVKDDKGDKEVLIIEEDRSEKLPPRLTPLKQFTNLTKSLFEKAGTKNQMLKWKTEIVER